MAQAEGLSPREFIQREEGTYNPALELFACDDCYIAMGQPTAGPRARWVADRLYEVGEVPGAGPLAPRGSPLRAAQDAVGDAIGAPRFE